MASSRILSLYTAAFLVFMFAPLILMIVSSFNVTTPPSVTDWRGFTSEWYVFLFEAENALRSPETLRALSGTGWIPETSQLQVFEVLTTIDRTALLTCLTNSLIVAAAVVPLSLLLGLSGAVLLTRWRSRFNGLLWWILLSPMLAPGVILGLSALVFWQSVGVDAGLFTIAMAQVTFIAGYPMLIIMARLQRQPAEHEEAALDLGASPWRTFRRITLPYLAPALATAGVIAFMASVENYNTTMFAKGGECTFATFIGNMSRQATGHPPLINAVGTIVIALTVFAAVAHTFAQRREKFGG